ncbi:LuxR C-terminal-related transcriptional regulator [Streptomyces netropsis]|uniref:LuxR C-terminal-related transcriptional regulator n=1 Tax=Streptomyces netropsis TaxID=55404 RepID=UPI0030CB9293
MHDGYSPVITFSPNERQLKIMMAVSRGWSNHRIGELFGLKASTIKSQLASIGHMTGAYTRVELVDYMCRLKLIEIPSLEKPANAQLTARQIQVLRGVANGMSHREIASKLFLTEHTVRSHTRRLYKRLGISGRVEAVVMAHALSLLD